MTTKFWLISLFAVIASFFGGFLVANAINRTELNTLNAENERLRSSSTSPMESETDATLDAAELKAKIAEADKNPSNFDFQKSLGLALYKYASMKKDGSLLSEASRLLERADTLKKDDPDVTVGLGNAYFDLGYFGKNNAQLVHSREYYDRALTDRPTDVEIRTDLGLTYFLTDPPDDKSAIAEFKRSLQTDPKHEKTLEFLIQSLIRDGQSAEAGKYLEKLRDAVPSAESIPGLTEKLQNAKISSNK